MPTPCIDALLPVSTMEGVIRFKLLSRNSLSKAISLPMPTAKLLIFFVILVRDQEAIALSVSERSEVCVARAIAQ